MTPLHLPRSGHAAARVLMFTLVQIAVIGWIYRANWHDGFAFLMGDVNDNTIEISILEHWYNVFSGLAEWSRTHYFHPYPGTLGYNDGYFFYGVLYSALRSVGCDPYMAATVVHMLLRILGGVTFYLFARRALHLGAGYALAGTVLTQVANGVLVHALHAQMLTTAFAPLCGLLLVEAVQAVRDHAVRRLTWLGIGFACVYGVWAMTSYYTLWFFSLFCLMTGAILLVRETRAALHLLRQLDRPLVLALLIGGAALVLALLPFLVVYLPKAKETGMHSFANAFGYTLAPIDLFNIGLGNQVYERFMPQLHSAYGFPIVFSENQTGFTPLVLLMFSLSLAYLWKRRHDSQPARLALVLGLATLLMGLLALRFGSFSAWEWVYHLVPGAKAVRVVARVLLFLVLPVAAVIMAGLALWAWGRRTRQVAAALVVALLIGEQWNSVEAISIERAPAMRMLRAAQPVPAGCRAFYVTDARPALPHNDPLYRHNVAAMLLSEYLNLPTVNGFSSFNPPGWDFSHPERTDYRQRVQRYLDSQGLSAVCALELSTMRWTQPHGTAK